MHTRKKKSTNFKWISTDTAYTLSCYSSVNRKKYLCRASEIYRRVYYSFQLFNRGVFLEHLANIYPNLAVVAHFCFKTCILFYKYPTSLALYIVSFLHHSLISDFWDLKIKKIFFLSKNGFVTCHFFRKVSKLIMYKAIQKEKIWQSLSDGSICNNDSKCAKQINFIQKTKVLIYSFIKKAGNCTSSVSNEVKAVIVHSTSDTV